MRIEAPSGLRRLCASLLGAVTVMLVSLSGSAQASQVDCTRITYNERIIINCVTNGDPVPTPTPEATPAGDPTATPVPTEVPTPEPDAGQDDTDDTEADPDEGSDPAEDAGDGVSPTSDDEDDDDGGAEPADGPDGEDVDRGGRNEGADAQQPQDAAPEPSAEIQDENEPTVNEPLAVEAADETEAAERESEGASATTAVRDGWFVATSSSGGEPDTQLLLTGVGAMAALGALLAVGARREARQGPN